MGLAKRIMEHKEDYGNDLDGITEAQLEKIIPIIRFEQQSAKKEDFLSKKLGRSVKLRKDAEKSQI